MSSQELLDRVTEITGVGGAEAQHLLEACANDVEAAVALFFEQAGDGGSTSADPSVPVIPVDTEEDNIRAPIAPVMEQLIGPGDDNFYSPAPSQTERRTRIVQRFKVCPLRDFAREGALMEEQLQATAGASIAPSLQIIEPSNSRSRRRARAASMVYAAQSSEPAKSSKSSLGDLFRPPTDISYSGPFQTARTRATELSHWLLVNVQSDNFDSQLLNRDVWSSKAMRQLIRRQFMLWQVDSDSVEGRRFVAFYHCAKMPYVCVIDPRTGEEVWKSPEPKASNLLPDLRKFLRQHKDFSEEMGDDAPSTSSKRHTITIDDDELEDGVSGKRAKLMELSEEEQIALAIRNSVRENSARNKADSSTSAANGNGNGNGNDKRDEDEDNNDDGNIDEAASDLGSIEEFDENDTKGACERTSYEEQLGAAKDELTTIKLRFLNAEGADEMTQLRWPSDTQLLVIRLYIGQCYQHIPKNGYKLICAFPRKTLSAEHDQMTLKEFGLHPSANLHITLDD